CRTCCLCWLGWRTRGAVKNKSIGSLIALAILAPSCGGGGSKTSTTPKNPPVLVKWQTQQRVPTSSNLRAVIFANTIQGIVGGDNGTFFRTDDGGATWTQQEFTPTNRSGDVLAMSASGKISRTTDTGNTWGLQQITPPTNNVKVFRRIYLTRTTMGLSRGYACGDDTSNNGVVLVTSLGTPDQWDLVTSGPAGAPSFRGVSFPVDDMTGWVVGDGGTIYKITLSGTTYTWTPQTSGTAKNLNADSFID